jgi:hypothetical protein
MDYGIDYFYNMLRMYSPTAKQICEARWNFVSSIDQKIVEISTVLDYGSGCGFFKAFAPKGIQVDTFDVMPVPQTGITKTKYDLVTFWDVLEHIPDLEKLESVFRMATWIAVTVPIKPLDIPWNEYKHFKPKEHVRHFQEDELLALLRTFGFVPWKIGAPECPPREMIKSFLFRMML